MQCVLVCDASPTVNTLSIIRNNDSMQCLPHPTQHHRRCRDMALSSKRNMSHSTLPKRARTQNTVHTSKIHVALMHKRAPKRTRFHAPTRMCAQTQVMTTTMVSAWAGTATIMMVRWSRAGLVARNTYLPPTHKHSHRRTCEP